MTSGLRISLKLSAYRNRNTEEIEPPHLVRAVVRAIPRADAAVVDHVVEPLGAVHRRADGTDQFARSVLALHAGDGLEESADCVRSSRGLFVGDRLFVVAIDADPVHFAAAHHLLFADDRDVVLRLAGDDARVAADAGIEIDGHAQRSRAVGHVLVVRSSLGRQFVVLVGRNSGFFRYFSGVPVAEDLAAFDIGGPGCTARGRLSPVSSVDAAGGGDGPERGRSYAAT